MLVSYHYFIIIFRFQKDNIRAYVLLFLHLIFDIARSFRFHRHHGGRLEPRRVINLLIILFEDGKRKAGAAGRVLSLARGCLDISRRVRTRPRGWKVVNLLHRIHAHILRSGIPSLRSRIHLYKNQLQGSI